MQICNHSRLVSSTCSIDRSINPTLKSKSNATLSSNKETITIIKDRTNEQILRGITARSDRTSKDKDQDETTSKQKNKRKAMQ
jgi:hypothetical protein